MKISILLEGESEALTPWAKAFIEAGFKQLHVKAPAIGNAGDEPKNFEVPVADLGELMALSFKQRQQLMTDLKLLRCVGDVQHQANRTLMHAVRLVARVNAGTRGANDCSLLRKWHAYHRGGWRAITAKR
jgi:hypothetical protein